MKGTKLSAKQKIQFRIRKKISGTLENPRLSVFRSNKEIYAQLIDDEKGKTLVSSSTMEKGNSFKGTKIEKAQQVGKQLAEKALSQKISKCKFDRNGYLYHGRVKALAEGAREAGLHF